MTAKQGGPAVSRDMAARDATRPGSAGDHVIVRASAGTGKTYQLVLRYIRRLYDERRADRLLAATFTRKAAGEILERVLLRLAKASLDPEECGRIGAEIGVPAFDVSACRGLLRDFGRQLHRVRIGTLDSLFSRLATSATLELGLIPGWEILDDQTDAQLREQAIAAILQQESTGSVVRLTKMLAKGESRRSVTSLIQTTIRDFYGLYLETDHTAWDWFPPSAPPLSGEVQQEIIERLQAVDAKDKRWASAIQKSCQQFQSADWSGLLAGGIAAKVLAGEPTFYGKPIPDSLRRDYSSLIDHVRSMLVLELTHQTRATYELLDRFHAAYSGLKQQSGGLRFEDVTRRLSATATGEGTQPWAFRLDGQVSHLLLDEFQDTSWDQWQVLRPMARDVTRTGESSSFFCVGDVKQAIYSWRGGMAELFDAIEDELPGLQSRPLNESRRSAPVIIETVNRVFEGLSAQVDFGSDEAYVRDWGRGFEKHSTALPDLPGFVRLVAVRDEPKDEDSHSGSCHREAAREIQNIIHEAPQHSIGVLLRTNRGVRQMIAELRNLNIPASEEGGNPLIDSAAVQLLMSLLRLTDHPGDTVARFHVAHSPLGRLLDFTDHADDDAALALAATVRRTLLESGYGQAFEQWGRRLAPHCSRRELSRLTQLIELAALYDSRSTVRATDFCSFVESERVKDPTGDAVQVMTIHSAKGLEFDVVVLPDLNWGWTKPTPGFVTARSTPAAPPDRVCLYRGAKIQAVLPAEYQELFRQTRARQVADSLCLLYVAMTRAVHALHLFIPEKPTTQSMAAIVQHTLGRRGSSESPSICYEAGDVHWMRSFSSDEQRRRNASEPPLAVESVQIRFADMPQGRVRGLTRMAPSRLETHRVVQIGESLKSRRGIALQRGNLFHAWFEQVEWLDDGFPDVAELREKALRMATSSLDVDRCLKDFQRMLQTEEVKKWLLRDSYLQGMPWRQCAPGTEHDVAEPLTVRVLQEQPMAVEYQGKLLVGTIDRLVLVEQGGHLLGADILDYKTDRLSAEQLHESSSVLQHYRLQLRAYRSTVCQVFGLTPEQISGRLLFVEAGVAKSV